MTISTLVMLTISGGFAPSSSRFDGFVPDAETAIAVARPMIRSKFGAGYLAKVEPLRARALKGFWVVIGDTRNAGEAEFLEPYQMALSPVNGGVVAFGVFDEKALLRQLEQAKAYRGRLVR
jgi:hypothetical protein